MTTDGARGGRELDLVLFGATGFTGSLVAEYLCEEGRPCAGPSPAGAATSSSACATSSRSSTRAARTSRSSSATASTRAPSTPSSGARASCAPPSAPTRATAPPRRRLRREGVHYCDLTGEAPFDPRHHRRPPRAGGGDGRAHRPLLRLRLHPVRPRRAHAPRAPARGRASGSPRCTSASLRMKGGASGGTIASMMSIARGRARPRRAARAR